MNKFFAGLMVLIHLLSIGCNSKRKSFRISEQGKFRFKNKKEFKADSQLTADFKANKFASSAHQLFDTTIGGSGYLYSWQEGDADMSKFTVIRDGRRLERGLSIYYFILDKNDSLLVCKQVAGLGSEGIFRFETRSKFLSKDTLVTISAVTQQYDLENNQKLESPKGDTTFKYLVIDKDRFIADTVFGKVKALNFSE